MKKNRLIFYAIFGVFHLSAFIFTIMLESNTTMLFSMVKYVPLFKYGTLLGLLLVIADFIWSWKINKELAKDLETREHELNILKAKLFDLQEAAKK